MYERIQGNDMYNAATNSPFDVNLNINNVLIDNPQLSALAGGGGVSAATTIPVSSIVGLNRNYKVPTSYQFSAGVQQALGRNAVFSISYVGNQNRFQSYSQETALHSRKRTGESGDQQGRNRRCSIQRIGELSRLSPASF